MAQSGPLERRVARIEQALAEADDQIYELQIEIRMGALSTERLDFLLGALRRALGRIRA